MRNKRQLTEAEKALLLNALAMYGTFHRDKGYPPTADDARTLGVLLDSAELIILDSPIQERTK